MLEKIINKNNNHSREEELVQLTQAQEEVIARLRSTISPLELENKLFRERISGLELENKLFKERISELERRLGLNSNTSSKLPASDGLNKQVRKPISLRGQGKPKGGQKLHAGKTMQQIHNPDKIFTHQVKSCCQCGNDLREEPTEKIIKRQVFDVFIQPLVTEHPGEVKKCVCKAYTTASFPPAVKGPVQVGTQ